MKRSLAWNPGDRGGEHSSPAWNSPTAFGLSQFFMQDNSPLILRDPALIRETAKKNKHW